MNRDEYLKKMRETFESCAKMYGMNLERDEAGFYIHDLTHSHFVFFSTAYQLSEGEKQWPT